MKDQQKEANNSEGKVKDQETRAAKIKEQQMRERPANWKAPFIELNISF